MNILIKRHIERYNALQPDGGKKSTPRVGFYLIQSVFEDIKNPTFYKAEAIWKENQDEKFIEGAIVEIQLTSLCSTTADPDYFSPDSLACKVVHIMSTFPSEIEFKSELRPIVKCNWKIDETPVIFEALPGFADLYFGTSSSCWEAQKKFENSLSQKHLSDIDSIENESISQASITEDFDNDLD